MELPKDNNQRDRKLLRETLQKLVIFDDLTDELAVVYRDAYFSLSSEKKLLVSFLLNEARRVYSDDSFNVASPPEEIIEQSNVKTDTAYPLLRKFEQNQTVLRRSDGTYYVPLCKIREVCNRVQSK